MKWVRQSDAITVSINMETDNGMTRRSALKRMGMAMAGALMSSSGLMSLTSCGNKDVKRVILYFTGTGNCLYVARQLGGKNSELLDKPELFTYPFGV